MIPVSRSSLTVRGVRSTGAPNGSYVKKASQRSSIAPVNFDFNFVRPPQVVSDHEGSLYGPGEIRDYKVGLIVGAGNPETQMIAARYILRAALDKYVQITVLPAS